MPNTPLENTFFEDIPIYKMPMQTFLDGMGFYGPLIVIFIVLFALRNQYKYMWVYFLAVFANNFVNRWLKSLFLEERPKNPIGFSKYETYKNVESYGMPSGHASAIGFSIIYLLLVKSHSVWLPVCIFIGILTMYQRVKYRRHTVEQVCMGAITGGICGWIAYSLATQWILWL
uniref:Phosphatidic acid phosphatase type 2/haloperoxidase domain-containing protein n=1 Tax=viral metagenome TaxID=1070528 RepID=A0A6C0JWQ1_9ZZZZ